MTGTIPGESPLVGDITGDTRVTITTTADTDTGRTMGDTITGGRITGDQRMGMTYAWWRRVTVTLITDKQRMSVSRSLVTIRGRMIGTIPIQRQRITRPRGITVPAAGKMTEADPGRGGGNHLPRATGP